MNVVSHQGILFKQLKEIFPGEDIQEDVKKLINVKFDSGKYMQFDVWVPKLGLCFEYQDEYHYVTTWYSELVHDKVKQKDNAKAEMVRYEKEVTLIHVPCWWDGSSERLVNTIGFQRPDIFTNRNFTEVVPLNPPPSFFARSELPEVGELMLASFPSNTQFSAFLEENNWWIGEKYDGLRCLWNPRDKIAYARHGGELTVLPSLTHCLPTYSLDGELWFGRQQYGTTFSLHSQYVPSNWEMLRMVSFDLPSREFHHFPFEDRFAKLLRRVSPELHPWTVVPTRQLGTNGTHVRTVSKMIIREGGEGVILRKKASAYEPGRSSSLVKLKSSHSDGEGIVVGVGPKKSVTIKLPNGKLLTVEGKQVLIPTPKKGEVVTFAYDFMARRDVPCNVRILRTRNDLPWEDILRNSNRDKILYEGPIAFSKESQGLWTKKKIRNFMEKFALDRGLDPLVAKTWYDSYSPIYATKVGRNLVKRTKGGYASLCISQFPEIKFDASMWNKGGYWQEVSNRRKFFEKLALKHGFDPLIPKNWYYFPTTHVKDSKGGSSVVRYHNESVSQALVDLFPDIGLVKSKFCVATIWADQQKRKAFLRKFARVNNFNYQLYEDWVSHLATRSFVPKAITRIVKFHNNSLSQALQDLFELKKK